MAQQAVPLGGGIAVFEHRVGQGEEGLGIHEGSSFDEV